MMIRYRMTRLGELGSSRTSRGQLSSRGVLSNTLREQHLEPHKGRLPFGRDDRDSLTPSDATTDVSFTPAEIAWRD